MLSIVLCNVAESTAKRLLAYYTYPNFEYDNREIPQVCTRGEELFEGNPDTGGGEEGPKDYDVTLAKNKILSATLIHVSKNIKRRLEESQVPTDMLNGLGLDARRIYNDNDSMYPGDDYTVNKPSDPPRVDTRGEKLIQDYVVPSR